MDDFVWVARVAIVPAADNQCDGQQETFTWKRRSYVSHRKRYKNYLFDAWDSQNHYKVSSFIKSY